MTENDDQPNNPLHGKTLETILTRLVDHYGWEELYNLLNFRCFGYDPSLKSSLKFLRRNIWAREKLERLYLKVPRKPAGEAGAKEADSAETH